jgi:hypothetical protein
MVTRPLEHPIMRTSAIGATPPSLRSTDDAATLPVIEPAGPSTQVTTAAPEALPTRASADLRQRARTGRGRLQAAGTAPLDRAIGTIEHAPAAPGSRRGSSRGSSIELQARNAQGPSTSTPDAADVARHATSLSDRLWRGLFSIDAVAALGPLHAHDRDFRQRYVLPSNTGTTLVQDLALSLGELEQGIASLDVPDSAKRTLLSDIESVRSDIASLTNDKKKAHYVAIALMRVLLTPLPLLVPLLSTPVQYKTAAMYTAAYLKTWLLAAGIFLTPTADSKAIVRHAINRDLKFFYSIMQLANLVKTDSADRVAHSIPYNVVIGLVGFAAVLTAFFGGPILAGAYNTTFKGHAKPSELAGMASALSPESREFIDQWSQQLADESDGIEGARHAFRESGRRLTDTADWQVGRIISGVQRLRSDLMRISGAPEVDTRGAVNRDRFDKGVLFATSCVILASPVVPCSGLFISKRPELVALGALALDFGIAALLMGEKWQNPAVSRQEAQDTMSQWVGFSGVMAYCFGANAATGDPASRGGPAFAALTIGLSIANITIATPQGLAIGALMGRVLKLLKGNDVAGARQAAQDLGGTILDALEEGAAAGDLEATPSVQQPGVEGPDAIEVIPRQSTG